MTARDGLLRMPFDRYGRYRLIADVLGRLGGGRDALRILDAGGGEGDLSGFLPGESVTVLEPPEAAGASGLGEGDAGALPFEDGAFDYVVSVDAYGRVEPGSREGYLFELRRTARRGVLLAAPFDSPAVRDAKRLADEFRRAVRPLEYARPAREPTEDGLPDLEDARRFFEGYGDAVSVLPSGYLPHWLAMTCLASYGPEAGGEVGGVLDGVNAFYNEFVYGSDNAEPPYRHLVVSLREPAGADLDGLVSAGPHPERASGSSALFGALAAVVPLAAEVRRLNVGLAEREGALARKEAQVDDLSRRLAGLVTADDARRGRIPAGTPARQPDIEQLRQSREQLRQGNEQLRRSHDELQRQLAAIKGSRAWRLLTVLRKVRLRIFGSG